MSQTATIDELNARARAYVIANFSPTRGKKPATIEQRQRSTRVDKGVPAYLQTLKCTYIPHSDAEILEPVMSGVRGLGSSARFVDMPTIAPANVEWLSVRRDKADADQLEHEERLSEKVAFEKLSANAIGKGTILFIHGGGWYQHGPGTYRELVGKLAKASGARVVQLDYRLGPQAAFPSQLCDLLLTYLTLLHPPPGSAHTAIDPSTLVVAGDSCGGKLGLVLGQLILEIRRQQNLPPSCAPTVTFHARSVNLPLPAGILTLSAASDSSVVGLPSWQRNSRHDIWDEGIPFVQPWWPADSIWPTSPPRGDLYCQARALSHPLVSPCLAPDWTGCCPLWLAFGEERLADGDVVLARQASSQGVGVRFHQYGRMPHVWPNVHRKLPQTKHVLEKWGEACRKLVEGGPWSGTRGIFWEVEKLEPQDLKVESLIDYSFEDAKKMIEKAAENRPVYTGQSKGHRL